MQYRSAEHASSVAPLSYYHFQRRYPWRQPSELRDFSRENEIATSSKRVGSGDSSANRPGSTDYADCEGALETV